jgi:hypothetical protein
MFSHPTHLKSCWELRTHVNTARGVHVVITYDHVISFRWSRPFVRPKTTAADNNNNNNNNNNNWWCDQFRSKYNNKYYIKASFGYASACLLKFEFILLFFFCIFKLF